MELVPSAHRFDEGRGIKFETFAERRVRGAMIDALRRDAWPRGVRRVRRELEAAREQLRRELGAEPTLSDLARRVGADESRLERTIVRISTIESTSPLANVEALDSATLPAVLVPYPHAADDHQRFNAAASVDAGAAEMILDAALDGAGLARVLLGLLDDPERCGRMAAAARALGRPAAAAAVADEVLALTDAIRP